jgi:hypothetical protein
MRDPGHRRTTQIGVRLTIDELEALRREGIRRGWSISQVVRKRALKGLKVGETVADSGSPADGGELGQ